MNDLIRQLISYTPPSAPDSAGVASSWRWAGLRLTARGFMAA